MKNLYEQSHALVQKLSGEVGQLMDENAGVLVKYKILVEDCVAAVEESYEATKKEGFYEKNPGREIPIQQMMGKEPTENSKGVRLVNLPQVRDIQNEEYEKMLAGEQTAQQALDNAVKRGNDAIKQALAQ